MKVLSFAAVGLHGREWCSRIASRGCLLACGFLVWCFAASVHTQSASPSDLHAELAAKIAAALAPSDPILLSVANDDATVRSEMTRQLRGRGLTVADKGDAGVDVHVSCGQNLRERVCAAAIRKDGALRVVAATQPREIAARPPTDPAVSLAVRSLLSRREPILDVAIAGDQMVVLGSEAIAIHSRGGGGVAAAPSTSAPIALARAWPRDLRGRLRIMTPSLEAFLPGVTCRGTITPLSLSCADETGAWPIGIDNSGIAASRNTFSTPEGLVFSSAAPLGSAGRARWLVADQAGTLAFLDGARTVIGRGEPADDVAQLSQTCAAGTFVVTSSRSPDNDGRDRLRLLRVTDLTLALVDELKLPGPVMALWSAASDPTATVILRRQNGASYEALHVTLACAR